jgi:hypothetical protein
MNGYLFTMLVIGAFGALLGTAPFENRPKWLNKLVVVWLLIWAGPPLVIVWINGVFG